MSRVSFATKCWGGDWQKLLAGGVERKVAACNYLFDKKDLIINNGVPEGIGGVRAKQTGNVYADGEMAAIENAKGYDYLVFVQGDCLTQGEWIEKGIKILEEHPEISVVSPASAVNTWHNEEGLDHYMSDQAWLVRVKEFRNPEVYQYSLKVPHDPDYPNYGGNSFEHMVGCYLKATGRYRKIIEEAYVIHPAA